jgi:SAM-dependent methyltransferase
MWDDRYSAEDYIYGKQPNDFLANVAASIPKGGRVLCIAEGEGRNSVFLAEQGYQVLAVDSSSVGLAKAQRLAAERGVSIETQVADLAEFPVGENAWDGVVSIFCHLPPPVRKALHAKLVAGLRSGGVLVLESYTPRQLEFKTGGPPVAEMMVTLDDLREELTGLEFRHAQEIDRDVLEGLLHTGTGAVVQLIAAKP